MALLKRRQRGDKGDSSVQRIIAIPTLAGMNHCNSTGKTEQGLLRKPEPVPDLIREGRPAHVPQVFRKDENNQCDRGSGNSQKDPPEADKPSIFISRDAPTT